MKFWKNIFGHSGYKYVTLQFERKFGNEGIEVLEGFICRQFSFQHFSNWHRSLCRPLTDLGNKTVSSGNWHIQSIYTVTNIDDRAVKVSHFRQKFWHNPRDKACSVTEKPLRKAVWRRKPKFSHIHRNIRWADTDSKSLSSSLVKLIPRQLSGFNISHFLNSNLNSSPACQDFGSGLPP